MNYELQFGQLLDSSAHVLIHLKQNVCLHPSIVDSVLSYIYSRQMEHKSIPNDFLDYFTIELLTDQAYIDFFYEDGFLDSSIASKSLRLRFLEVLKSFNKNSLSSLVGVKSNYSKLLFFFFIFLKI